MSFSLEDLDRILGNAGLLTAEQYEQVRGLLERALAEGNAPAAAAAAATPSSSALSSSFPSATAGAPEADEQGPSDEQEMGEATAEADGQEQEEEEKEEDGDVPMEGATDNVASTTADGGAAPVATAMVTTVVPVAPAATAAANAVPVVLPATRTNLPIQTRFLGMANILTADVVLPPVVMQPSDIIFTPIARASTQPPAAITDDAIAQQFCRLWSLQFTARDTRRRANQAHLVYDHNRAAMDNIATVTYGVLFQRMGPPSRIHGWPQMTDLVTNMGYDILKILYDHRHALAPGEFHAHAVALELVRSRDSTKNHHGVLVQTMFTAAGF